MKAELEHRAGTSVRTLELPSGRQLPILGQGTWGMGEDRDKWELELAALRLGLDLGLTLIDTAEMYGEGTAEELVGEAIADRREEVFLVSKVYPHNATRHGAIEACERSLRRLQTDYLDLYLLHWRGSVPLDETFEAFQELKQSGMILDYGVSNFDVDDMIEAYSSSGGDEIVVDQVLFNLVHRGVEWDLIPWSRKRGIDVIAYSPVEHSPVEQRGILNHPALQLIALRHGATPVQIAIAWILHQGVAAIPKASNPEHVRENRGALEIRLTERDLAELDAAFPPPHGKVPLEVR